MSPSENDFNYTLDRFTILTTELIQLALEERKKITNLHESCLRRNIDNDSIVQMITPFNLNSLDKYHRSLLHKAVKAENYELVKILIYFGAYINTVDIWNKTPLISAIELNCTQIANLLISRMNTNDSMNHNFQTTQLTTSIYHTYLNAMNQIYQYLNSLNNEPCYNYCLQITRTKIPLHLSVSNSNFEITYCLLLNGADPNERDYLGLSALHRAATLKNLNIVKLLVKFGADVNLKSFRKILPLHWSCRWSDVQTICFLAEKTTRYNLNQLDHLKFTPLDRLWSRINSFKYKELEDKIDYDNTIRVLYSAFKKLIQFGCILKMFKFDPFKIYHNYYLINNLLMLFETLFTIKRPSIDYCQTQQALQLFTVNTMKFLIDKLAIKYSVLTRQRLDKLSQGNLLFESEFNDLVNEIKRLKQLIFIILTSGQFIYEFNCTFETYHLYSMNRELLSDLFSNYIGLIDVISSDLFNFNDKITLSVDNLHQMFISYIFNYSFNCLKQPLTLQELCRIKIKNSMKVFTRKTVDKYLDLTQPSKEYLFYN